MGSSAEHRRLYKNPESCKTPGAIYETSFRSKQVILEVNLPVEFFEDLSKRKEKKLAEDLHNALLPAMEQIYREFWSKLAGKVIEKDDEPMPRSWTEL